MLSAPDAHSAGGGNQQGGSTVETAMQSMVDLVDQLTTQSTAFKASSLDWTKLDTDMQTLYAKGVGSVVGEWLGRKVCEAFEAYAIEQYAADINQEDPEQALQRLHNSFLEYQRVVNRCAERLRFLEAVSNFVVFARCSLLQDCMVTGKPPRGKDALMRYLLKRGREVLAKLEAAHSTNSPMSSFSPFDGSSSIPRDAVLDTLSQMGLSQASELKKFWCGFLVEAVARKVVDMEEDFTAEKRALALLKWKEDVLDQFAQLVLCGNDTGAPAGGRSSSSLALHRNNAASARMELQEWSHLLEQWLVKLFARKLINSFFYIIVEFPDSTPALRDLQHCLGRCDDSELDEYLVNSTRALLRVKLHHAGVQTDDILTMVVGYIRALCILYPKNRAPSIVSAVVGETLDHLRKRKDCISVVVRSVIQPNEDSLLHKELQLFSGAGASQGGGSNENDSDDELLTVADATSNRQPDVLRVLLSAVTLTAIVQEYQNLLAGDLIAKQQLYNVDKENEVLERMKCIFGEESLVLCAVMIRDIEQSRRLNSAVHNRGNVRKTTEAQIVSATCWPKHVLRPDKYTPHPVLAREAEEYAKSFKTMKPNQLIDWCSSQGSVVIEVVQSDPAKKGAEVATSFNLSLFVASIVLHLRENESAVSIADLAKLLECTPQMVHQHVQQHFPALFVVHSSSSSGAGGAEAAESLSLQRTVVSSNPFLFDEAPTSSGATPSGFTEEQTNFFSNMIAAMVKTGGSKSVTKIENSMKMFGGFQGTTAQVKSLLAYLAKSGKLVALDDGTYAAPKLQQ